MRKLKVRENLKKLISPLGLVGLVLSAGVIVMLILLARYTGSGYYCADALECTFQALEMKASGTLFPDTWAATNFAHLQVLPLYLGLRLLSSGAAANFVCGLVMLALSLAAIALLWRWGLRDGSGLLLAACYVFPVSQFTLHQLFVDVYYAQFVIVMFVVLAAWLPACFGRDGRGFSLRPGALAVAFAATFACCSLTGSRMIAVICLPIAGAVVWMAVFDRHYVRGDWRHWLSATAAALAVGAAAVLGNRVYESVVAPSFGTFAAIPLADNLLQFVQTGEDVLANLRAIWDASLRLLGVPFGYRMTHPYAVMSMPGFLSALCLYVLFPCLETCAYRRLDGKSRFLIVTTWLSVAVTAFILMFGSLAKGDECGMCTRYLILPSLLLLVVGVRYFHRTFFLSSDLRLRIAAMGLLLALMTATCARWYDVSTDGRSPWNEVLTRLRAEGLNYGFATYENAFLPTFYSDGDVFLPHVAVDEGRLSVPGWCTAERWYESENHVGPTFLMLTDDELARYAPKGLAQTALGEPRKNLKVGRFNILVFDYNICRDRFGTMRGDVHYFRGFQEKWVSKGRARMELVLADGLQGKNLDLELTVQSFGEKVTVFAGNEILGTFQFPESSVDWTEKTVRFRVPARATGSDRLALRFEATGVKSPKERGWHDDKTKLGPRIISAKVTAGREKEGGR